MPAITSGFILPPAGGVGLEVSDGIEYSLCGCVKYIRFWPVLFCRYASACADFLHPGHYDAVAGGESAPYADPFRRKLVSLYESSFRFPFADNPYEPTVVGIKQHGLRRQAETCSLRFDTVGFGIPRHDDIADHPGQDSPIGVGNVEFHLVGACQRVGGDAFLMECAFDGQPVDVAECHVSGHPRLKLVDILLRH